MQGWTERSAAPGAWTVSNGILSGARDAGFLYSQRGDYRNFHFRIEARLERNSLGGQGFRALYRTLPHGYYVQSDIGRAPPGNKTGSLFIARDFGEITQLAGVREVLSPNEWYTQEIVAVDNRITVFVNERRVVDYIDAKNTFASGHVTLFTASAPIQYRKVEIKELKNAPPGR
ncbi:MAG: DUF1080 domain-containing protein [Planctomycetia bacterium]|nr:DUF1080 domain-containing protein [Planctomycetia bacterium]